MRIVIWLGPFENGEPHAHISVPLVVFQWDQKVLVLTVYRGSVYILNGVSCDSNIPALRVAKNASL